MTGNETIQSLLNHRSVRDFKPQPLDDQTLATLLEVAHQGASSMFLQEFSILSITDQAIKDQLAEICGQSQHQVNRNGHLFVFVADQYRNQLIASQQQVDTTLLHETDRLLGCVYDATIGAQSLITAAESLGLGTVVLGSILNDARQVIQLLHLPHLTFPLFAVAVGYPNDLPEQKPRLPQSVVNFTNTYQLPADFEAQLDAYDTELQSYYEQRHLNPRRETFRQSLAREVVSSPRHRRELLAILKEQGFLEHDR